MADRIGIGFYCEVCHTHRAVQAITVASDDLNPEPWGDIVCSECHFVIATIVAQEPGTYRVERIGD